MNNYNSGVNNQGFLQGDVVLYRPPNCEPFRGQIIDFLNDNLAYVHFIGQNRRNDAAIDSKQLQFVEHGPAASSEPPHRGRKKKRSELEYRVWTIEEIIKYEVGSIRNIDVVEFRDYSIRAWYMSPYPEEYVVNRKIYVCDTCLKYFSSRSRLVQHMSKRHKNFYPPGFEIYRDIVQNDEVSFFEVDGAVDTMFCQCLCLLGKLFLEDKCVFFDVGRFMFYVLAIFKDEEFQIVGFYSMDKMYSENILACIATLPQYQNRGFGKMLISLAYAISKRKKKKGGPEAPLSDLGQIAFKSYWRDAILSFLHNYGSENSDCEQISQFTYILPADVNDILKELDLVIRFQKGKPPKIDIPQAELLYEKYKNQMAHFKEESLIWLPKDMIPHFDESNDY